MSPTSRDRTSLPYEHSDGTTPRSVVDFVEKALWCLQEGPRKKSRPDTAIGHLERALVILRGKPSPPRTPVAEQVADSLDDLAVPE